MPAAKYQFWFIRYAIYCPFALLVWGFSYHKYFKRYLQISIASVVALAGFGIIAMILLAPQSGSNSYYAGLILVLIFGYTFFKLDFIFAAATGVLIVIAYEVAAIWVVDTPIPILINNNFFFNTSAVPDSKRFIADGFFCFRGAVIKHGFQTRHSFIP